MRDQLSFSHHPIENARPPFHALAAGWLSSAAALFLLNAALTAASAAPAGEIPNRPEALTFSPLDYEPPKASDYRVALKAGPIAYVVPDRELPLVNVVILVRAGEYLDPQGKTGLSELTGYLLARGGTKSTSAEDLEEQLAFLAAQLDSGLGDSQGSVRLNLLAKDMDRGLAILREVLTTPRFQEDKLELRKQQLLQFMRQRNDDSSDIEAREAAFLAFGEHFWANRQATAGSITGITRADLEEYHRQWFHPSNFVVAASGDFSREEMVDKLERLFGNWPFQGLVPPAIPTNTVFAKPGAYIVNKDVNQGRVSLLMPGILRDHPDFFRVQVMNDILGGGGFTSRIMNRVRSDEGLAYSAFSSFPGGVYYPLTFTAGFQTKSRTVAYASSIIKQEITRIQEEPVSEPELRIVKRGFIERFPRTFATKAQVANVFAQDEFTGRYAKEPDYWQKYRPRIERVSREEVQRVARERIALDQLVLLVVGDKKEILLGHPDHPVQLGDLVGGKITELPLRDPMTMEPLPLAGSGQ